MKKLGILLVVVSLLASRVRAEGDGDRVQKVAADIQQALDARKAADAPARAALPADVRAALVQIKSAPPGGETLYIESALDQLAIYLDAGPVRQECVELAATLRGEREAAEKKTLQDITSALDRAAAAVRAAKTPAELDPVVNELGRFGSNRGENMYYRVDGMSSRPVMAAQARAGAALRFVTQWQDYLSEMVAGNREQSNQTLRSLSQNEVYLIPRSEILARLHEDGTTIIGAAPTPAEPVGSAETAGPSVVEIVAGIKTLDELAPGLDALDKISREEKEPRHAHAAAALTALSPLDQVYRDFRAGQSTRVELPSISLPTPGTSYYGGGHSGEVNEALSRAIQDAQLALRRQLLVLSLPRYLDLPPETRAKPGEGPIDFLDRIRAESLKAGDYLGAARADETRAILRTGNQTASESSQASQFITANRLEAARQYSLAVASYERALASGTELVPAKVIGDRLDAIKAEHPQEFQQGMDLYLSPPRPDYPFYPPGMTRRPGVPPYGRSPNSPPETPALSIPAATATPAASASPTPK